jgi:hypothetical protein
MMHTNYQPARKGLTDEYIRAQKVLRAVKNGPQVPELRFSGQAMRQHSKLRYSDQGDFTRCYRGGF